MTWWKSRPPQPEQSSAPPILALVEALTAYADGAKEPTERRNRERYAAHIVALVLDQVKRDGRSAVIVPHWISQDAGAAGPEVVAPPIASPSGPPALFSPDDADIERRDVAAMQSAARRRMAAFGHDGTASTS